MVAHDETDDEFDLVVKDRMSRNLQVRILPLLPFFNALMLLPAYLGGVSLWILGPLVALIVAIQYGYSSWYIRRL